MTQRLNISIQDEIHQRLQIVKDKINVSQICQTAIENAIEYEEAKSGPDIAALIAKVKIEKARHFKRYRDEGFYDGKNNALSFSYRNFIELFETVKEKEYSNLYSEEAVYLFANEACKKKAEAIGAGELTLDEDTDLLPLAPYDASDEYSKGWLDGVQFIWEQVKKKI